LLGFGSISTRIGLQHYYAQMFGWAMPERKLEPAKPNENELEVFLEGF
jgi:hypothetical protein